MKTKTNTSTSATKRSASKRNGKPQKTSKAARQGGLWSAGGPGFSSKTDLWATPPHVFDALDAEFSFELDVCASDENAKCARYFTVADDGLAQQWTGVVWMNPPYGRAIGDWMKKAADAAEDGATVVCLVPSRTDTRWWHEQVLPRASEVRHVRGRLAFGDQRAPAPFPSALVIYRPKRDGLLLNSWTPPVKPRTHLLTATPAAPTAALAATPVPTVAAGCALNATRSAASAAGSQSPGQPAAPPARTTPVASRFPAGTLAIVTATSANRKLGNAATTYAAQTSCPTSCPFFDGGGCYANAGALGTFITAPLNAAANAVEHSALDVAHFEAKRIRRMRVKPGRPLRLHTVGDCTSDEAARVVADAAAVYVARGGGPVWTYTHAWRDVARESWGEISALASCETSADVADALDRGYAPSIVAERFDSPARHILSEAESESAAGVDVLPCPQQTKGRTCSDCKLCFDDAKLRTRGYAIGFEVHGSPDTVRRAQKALRDPNDPTRKLSTRQLIPQAIAAINAEGGTVTNAEIARRIGCAPSSVAEMRRRLAGEPARRSRKRWS